MAQGGFLDTKPRSPGGLVIVIAAHAAVLSALAMAKMETPVKEFLGPLTVTNIPEPTEPPPIPPEAKPKTAEPQHKTVLTRTDPIIKTETKPIFEVSKTEPTEIAFNASKPGPIVIEPTPPPPKPLPDPVRIEARLSASSALLPPYPQEEVRAEREGSVTIRLVIGSDGRVKRAERVSAASDAFWRATERHALRNWRFKPATLDGKPVESVKTMTVRFVLDS